MYIMCGYYTASGIYLGLIYMPLFVADVKDNGNTASRVQTWVSSLVAMVSALYLCHLR